MINKKTSVLESRIARLEKRLTKKNEAMGDWDFDEMLNDYGEEFLSENYPDSVPMSMDDIDEELSGIEPHEILRMAFSGRRFGYKQDSFNPNDDYFTYDGYGNLESIPYLDEYLKDRITERELFDWCVEQGYVEE